MFAPLPDDFPRRRLIEDLARRLACHPEVVRVWLFGSRARRDNFERSDIDLAIQAPALDPDDWLRIKLDFEDEAPTLLLIDLVRFEDAPEHLREQIRDEGIVIYDRARLQHLFDGLDRSLDRLGEALRSAPRRRLPSTARFRASNLLSSCSGRQFGVCLPVRAARRTAQRRFCSRPTGLAGRTTSRGD